ncbi:MAG: class II histone deacetylase, partial [Paracoccaceae bacterium]
VACGFDASGVDPLSRMICSAKTYSEMTKLMMKTAKEICKDRLVFAHEGGYSEVHVPFCAHAVLQELSGSKIDAGDPLAPIMDCQQPNNEMLEVYSNIISRYKDFFQIE